MHKRLLKTLRRVEARKSVPDTDAYFMLADQGYISIKGRSDDIETVITPRGLKALADYKELKV